MAWFELVFLGVTFFLCYKGAVVVWGMRDVQPATGKDLKALMRFLFPYKAILMKVSEIQDEQERLRISNQQLRENADEGANVPDGMGGRSVSRSE